jgi:hypothetical protein
MVSHHEWIILLNSKGWRLCVHSAKSGYKLVSAEVCNCFWTVNHMKTWGCEMVTETSVLAFIRKDRKRLGCITVTDQVPWCWANLLRWTNCHNQQLCVPTVTFWNIILHITCSYRPSYHCYEEENLNLIILEPLNLRTFSWNKLYSFIISRTGAAICTTVVAQCNSRW